MNVLNGMLYDGYDGIVEINLTGGTINLGSCIEIGEYGVLNITAGTLVIDGNVTSNIDAYVAVGKIVGYDGAGTINNSYSSGHTTVTATSSVPGTYTWTGNGTNTSWATAANWYGNAVPTSTIHALFDDSAICTITANAVCKDLRLGFYDIAARGL